MPTFDRKIGRDRRFFPSFKPKQRTIIANPERHSALCRPRSPTANSLNQRQFSPVWIGRRSRFAPHVIENRATAPERQLNGITLGHFELDEGRIPTPFSVTNLLTLQGGGC